MPKEKLDENFLKLEASVELSQNQFYKISGKQTSQSFWAYDEAMKRKQGQNPALKRNLLKMKFKDEFQNYLEFQCLRRVLENFSKEPFVAAEHPRWIAFLKGESLIVLNNVIHVKTNESFLECTQDNLEKSARALLETWMSFPNIFLQVKSLEGGRLDHFADLDHVRVTRLRKGKDGGFSFTIVFDAKVKLNFTLDQNWNPDDYREPMDFGRYPRIKLVWDLLNYNEKFRIERRNYMLYPCLNPTSWNEYIEWINFLAVGKEGNNFMNTMRLLSEFSTDGEFEESLKKLEKFQKGKYLYGVQSPSLFSRNIREIGRTSLEFEIANVQDLLDGLYAANGILHRYANKTSQFLRKNISVDRGIGLLIAQKVALDPVLYVEDSRPYIASLAKVVIAGNLDVNECPH